MSIRQALNSWNGNPTQRGSVSVLRQDEGITGLKLITDEESVVMQDYVRLPGQTLHRETAPDLHQAILDDIADEFKDYGKYSRQAELAEKQLDPHFALILRIIAREEKNHHEILEALINGDGGQEEYDRQEMELEYKLTSTNQRFSVGDIVDTPGGRGVVMLYDPRSHEEAGGAYQIHFEDGEDRWEIGENMTLVKSI